MKKIIGLTIAFMLAVGMLGVGTFALFNDTETSAGNMLTAGILDLKTDDTDGVSQTLYANYIVRNETVGPSLIQLRNIDSVDGSSLDISFSYDESDDIPNNVVDMGADETAGQLEVTELKYHGDDLLESGIIYDANGNEYTDIYDLVEEDLSGQIGIAASEMAEFRIAVQLRNDTSESFRADGIVLTMTFILNQ